MKIIKVFLKLFFIIVLLIAVGITSISLYMKFYGKDLLEGALSNMLGAKVEFENISVNLDKYTVNFKGFSIPSEIGFDEKNVFNAKIFKLVLNKERFDKEKRIAFEEIIIKKGILNIERNRNGEFNLSYLKRKRFDIDGSLAYADEKGQTLDIYNIVKNIRSLVIEDSVVRFKDYYVPQGPFAITCDDLSINLATKSKRERSYDTIPARCVINFRIPERERSGRFLLDADMLVSKEKVDIDADIKTQYIDLMRFLPYFNSYTPFSFRQGVFSSETKFTVKDHMIDSLTVMVFHRLNLVIDPGMESARFLETSVNRLAPYLMSKRGDIVFDFVIKGPLDNPRIGLGPRVKFAIGLVVIEELGNMFQQFQRLRGLE